MPFPGSGTELLKPKAVEVVVLEFQTSSEIQYRIRLKTEFTGLPPHPFQDQPEVVQAVRFGPRAVEAVHGLQ